MSIFEKLAGLKVESLVKYHFCGTKINLEWVNPLPPPISLLLFSPTPIVPYPPLLILNFFKRPSIIQYFEESIPPSNSLAVWGSSIYVYHYLLPFIKTSYRYLAT